MMCPKCSHDNTDVKDSRRIDDNKCVRRRRICPHCRYKFVTVERIQIKSLRVIKSSGIKKPFDRNKIARSIATALRKRDFDQEVIEKITDQIVQNIESSGMKEISTSKIGDMVLEALARVDQVAYIRFASVYRNFESAADFVNFVTHNS